MNVIERVYDCGVYDRLSGSKIHDGESLEIRWPNGQSEEVIVSLKRDAGSVHCQGLAFIQRFHNGVKVEVPLLGLSARRLPVCETKTGHDSLQKFMKTMKDVDVILKKIPLTNRRSIREELRSIDESLVSRLIFYRNRDTGFWRVSAVGKRSIHQNIRNTDAYLSDIIIEIDGHGKTIVRKNRSHALDICAVPDA